MNIAVRLKELRVSAGITQKELATSTGIALQSIINYENGRREPNSKAMVALERYFNVTGEYLRGESSERTPEYSWEDPEIMAAIRASFPDQLRQLNDTLKDCSAEEQQAVFTILVQLRSVLNLKDAAKRQTAISMIRNVAVDVEHLTSDGTAKEG
ncbi:MAG: helix-turn-helix transcriptional regulator [Flintibacter sp.]|uniref:helix-turn-helix domain-containing protein n=1 Tax=Flintibacter sp. TaxID=1918624 RepID=UPI002D80FC66|nr:helix-turn-helix transcriptional regulator [Flintibacter sp.]MCI7158242.1 helix-turn-helix transcriptional regulator [Flintibacter sp.]